MPQIPDYRAQVGLPTETGAVKVPVELGAEPYRAMAVGAEQVANVASALDSRLVQLRQVQELVDLKTRSTRDLYDLQAKFVNSPDFIRDPESTLKSYTAGVAQLRNNYLGTIGDAEVKAHFDEHFSNLSLSRETEMRHAARKQRIESAKGTLDSSLFSLKQIAEQAQNEADVHDSIKQGISAIDGMAATGAIGLDDAPKMKRKFVSDIGNVLVDRDIRSNPTAALNGLLGARYDKLIPDEAVKEKLIEKAQRQADILTRHNDAEFARMERQYDREMKRARDETEMDLWGRLHSGDNITTDLEAARKTRVLDASGYNALRRAVSNEEGSDNPSIALELQDKILSGHGNRDEILRFVGNGISHKTAGDLLQKLRTVNSADDISKTPVYKDAHDFIKAQLTTTGPLEAISQDDESRRAYAVREYDARVRAGEDAWAVADDVVLRGKKQAAGASFYLKPRFLDGPASDLSELDKAEQLTVEKFKAGELPPDVFKIEMSAIDANRKFLIRQGKEKGTIKPILPEGKAPGTTETKKKSAADKRPPIK